LAQEPASPKRPRDQGRPAPPARRSNFTKQELIEQYTELRRKIQMRSQQLALARSEKKKLEAEIRMMETESTVADEFYSESD
jgi:hypothetical protein